MSFVLWIGIIEALPAQKNRTDASRWETSFGAYYLYIRLSAKRCY